MKEVALIDLFANIGSLYHACKDFNLPCDVIYAYEPNTIKACVLIAESEIPSIVDEPMGVEIETIVASFVPHAKRARTELNYKNIVVVASLTHLVDKTVITLSKCLRIFTTLKTKGIIDSFIIYTNTPVVDSLTEKLRRTALAYICNRYDVSMPQLGIPINTRVCVVTDRNTKLDRFDKFVSFVSWKKLFGYPESAVILNPSIPKKFVGETISLDNFQEGIDYTTENLYSLSPDNVHYIWSEGRVSTLKPLDFSLLIGFQNITLDHSWINKGEIHGLVADSIPPLVHRTVILAYLSGKHRRHFPVVQGT